MNTKSKFFSLKEEWKKAKGAEREAVEQKMDAFFASLSDAEKEEVQTAVSDDFTSMHSEIAEISEILDVREKLAPVLPIISISYISKNFFGKSTSWFYQRLNGNIVHGKQAKFTNDEIKKLDFALHDISRKIGSVAIHA
ncbi:hypothetical protein AGMMS49982_21540 [Bacteroidia bacterium]|nr:hypothetical protein AGMMS49982_21540 [Bacteroidia bacterium]